MKRKYNPRNFLAGFLAGFTSVELMSGVLWAIKQAGVRPPASRLSGLSTRAYGADPALDTFGDGQFLVADSTFSRKEILATTLDIRGGASQHVSENAVACLSAMFAPDRHGAVRVDETEALVVCPVIGADEQGHNPLALQRAALDRLDLKRPMLAGRGIVDRDVDVVGSDVEAVGDGGGGHCDDPLL